MHDPLSHDPLPANGLDISLPPHSPLLSEDSPGGDAKPAREVELASPGYSARATRRWSTLAFLSRVLMMLAFLLLLQYYIPFLAEQVQYGLTRGRQRAQYENATLRLKDTGLVELSRAYQLVSERVGPSVVHIRTAAMTPVANDFSRFLGTPKYRTDGQGSGVIIDAEGFILTNEHVVNGSAEIKVSLSDGRLVPARVVGVDRLTDLAVLKVEAGKLIALEWGDSDELEVGALVWAIGSPFGLDRSITSGIVSAKHRSEKTGRPHQDFLQTDAAVNPGNSGGPLVDALGRVVGINTAIIGEAYQGISFSIPSNVARQVYQDIRHHRRVARGWLGVALSDLAENSGEDGAGVTKGAKIEMLVTDTGPSPAGAAGLEPGDIIVRWNDTPVESRAGLMRLVGKSPIGTTAKLHVFRNGEEKDFDVTIAERPTELNK